MSSSPGNGDTRTIPFRVWQGTPADLPDDTGWVSCDTETSGLHPDDGARVSAVSVAWAQDGVVYYTAWPFGQGPDHEAAESIRSWINLLDWLQSRPGLIGHNFKFDLHMLRSGTVLGLPGRHLSSRFYWDTMIAAKELWPLRPVALKQLAVLLFGEDADAEQKALKPHLGPKTDPRFDLVPWEVMGPYAAKDALYTHLLFELQQRQCAEGYAGSHWIRREMRVNHALYRMEVAGIPYDAKYSLEIAGRLQDRQEVLRQKLPFEPKDAKKWYFTDTLPGALNRTPLSRTAPTARFPEGQIQLTGEVLQRMQHAGDYPHVSTLAEYNSLATALKMWYKPYAARTDRLGRLRCSFRQVASGWGDAGGTASGRFSVERVNLQAIPQDYRITHGEPTPRGVIASAASKLEGWDLYELDLSQAELRVAAMWAKCERMLDAIHNKRDLHGETAQELFKVDPDHAEWTKYRQIAKRANFSLIFGAGWKTFRAMIAKEADIYLSPSESKQIVWGWNDLYPQYYEAIYLHQQLAENAGFVELANGRRRPFRAGEQTHKAFNQRVQASIAELGKDWLILSDQYLKPLRAEGLDDGVGHGGLLMVIHDSQVLLLPAARAQQFCDDVRVMGLRCWSHFFPGVPGEIEAKAWSH